MTPPLDVLRELRATGVKLRPRPISILEILVGGVLLAGALGLLVTYGEPAAHWLRHVQYRGGRFGVMLVMTPVLLVTTLLALAYRSWRNRGTEPFPFPVTVHLPRWRIYRRDGDEALHLTDGRGMLSLIVRATEREPLEAVLDAVDPEKAFDFEEPEGASDHELLQLELADEGGRDHPVHGLLRRTDDPRAYMMLLGNTPALLDDGGGPLRRARLRPAGAAPQKWRPADAPKIAAAHVRRR